MGTPLISIPQVIKSVGKLLLNCRYAINVTDTLGVQPCRRWKSYSLLATLFFALEDSVISADPHGFISR